MYATEKIDQILDVLLVIAWIFATLVPIIHLLGHLRSKEDFAELYTSPLLLIYFPFAFVYGYLYWFEPGVLEYYFFLNESLQTFFYFMVGFAILFEKKVPHN